MKFFDAFSGIGGFTLPLVEAGHECIGYSEVDKYAIQIYQRHFQQHQNYGDIIKLDPTLLQDFDILCGGFPCQAFSSAGKRGGFDDRRGALVFEIARIARAKRPRLLFLENVMGLLNHDGGRTFRTILSTLDELGYNVQWEVLNSRHFGVPQNRERVFFVGHRRGTTRPEVFPLRQGYGENTPGRIRKDKHCLAGCVGTRGARFRKSSTLIGTIDRGQFRETGGIALTIPATYCKGHDNRGARPIICEGAGQSGMTRLSGDAPRPRLRRLTPLECERLQGFPDGWTEGASDTQRYKCIGNAVTLNVVRAIVKSLKN